MNTTSTAQPTLIDVSDLKASMIDDELEYIASLDEAAGSSKKSGKKAGSSSSSSKGKEKAEMKRPATLNKEQRAFAQNNYRFDGEVGQVLQDEMNEKIRVIGVIQQFHERWPEENGPFRKVNPAKVTLEELNATLGEIRSRRNRQFAPRAVDSLFTWAAFGCELGWQGFGYGNTWGGLNLLADMNLAGLAKRLEQDKSLLQEELDEFTIVYGSMLQQPLFMRFALKAVMIARAVAAENARLPTPSAAAPPTTQQAYADL